MSDEPIIVDNESGTIEITDFEGVDLALKSGKYKDHISLDNWEKIVAIIEAGESEYGLTGYNTCNYIAQHVKSTIENLSEYNIWVLCYNQGVAQQAVIGTSAASTINIPFGNTYAYRISCDVANVFA